MPLKPKTLSKLILISLLLTTTTNAWVEPSDTSNIVAPINTGATAQTKQGDLGTSGNLCIKGDCKGTWPSFSSSDTLQSVTARGNTTDRNLNTSSGINMGANQTFYAPGRMHIFGEENLYFLNRGTTYVSRAWGGSGNLAADGSISAGGNLSAGDSVCLRGDCRTKWPINQTWYEYSYQSYCSDCSSYAPGYDYWGYYLKSMSPDGVVFNITPNLIMSGYRYTGCSNCQYYYSPF